MQFKKTFVFLASKSPRRAEILTQMGLSFRQLQLSVPEKIAKNESCDEYISRLSYEKAIAGLNFVNEKTALIIAADTVILFNDKILEKPKDQQDGMNMLGMLSNQRHLVKTAVTVCNDHKVKTIIQTNTVKMRSITEAELLSYWRTGEPKGKAGAYAIQGRGAMFIKHIEGSYSGIMGLPIYETAQILNEFGIDVSLIPVESVGQ